MPVILKKILGVICVILGLLALVTPFTPGSWLALIGLELLDMNFLIPKSLRKYVRSKATVKKDPQAP